MLAQSHDREHEVLALLHGECPRWEVAKRLGISVATADDDWAYAKGWLKAELAGNPGIG